MKSVSLSGSLRENVGKKDAKMHRREGKVPCVLYGGNDQIHFTVDDKSFSKLLFTPDVSLVRLNIDGAEYETIIQDVQYHPVTDRTLHVDFLLVHPEKPVVIGIPITLSGTARGVLQGGKLIKKTRKLKVKALAKDLPDSINIDITNLEIGDSVKVGDITRDNVIFLDPASNVIVGVRTARTVVEETGPGVVAAEGAPAEGEKKEEGK